MPSTINASTASGGGIISAADSSGVLELQTAGTSALVIETTGNINIPGTGKRITGDFSTSTITNKVIFQTSTANSPTSLSVAPSGSSASSYYDAWIVSSGFTNTAYARFGTDGSLVRIESSIVGSGTYLPITMWTSNSERLRIDTSGNVGIGTSSPTALLHVAGGARIGNSEYDNGSIELNIQGTGDRATFIDFHSSGTPAALDLSARIIRNSGANGNFGITNSGSGNITFENNNAERARIDSNGNLLVGTTSGSRNIFSKSNAAGVALQVVNPSTNTSSSALELNVGYTGNTSGYFILAGDNFNYRFFVATNGNVTNSNNSYGAISDIKLKENIVDATPKLDQICQVKVRNYNLIGDSIKQIGVVAQELEEIFPSMIEESLDRDKEGNVLETTTKQVKYSVFVPMLIKAIQEQQAIITDLKARIEALENK